MARRLVSELRRLDMDVPSVLSGLGFTSENLAEPAFFLTYEQTCQLIRRSLRLLNEPHLGLRLGASANLASWGVFYVGLMSCANSREWLELAADFLPSVNGLLQLRCEETPHGTCLTARGIDDDPEVVTFLVEKAFSALTRAYRVTVDPKEAPVLVELAMPTPRSLSLHQRSFGREVRFAHAANRIVFAHTAVPVQTADAVTALRVREAMTKQVAAGSGRSDLESCVVRALAGHLVDPPALAEIARSIHMSERTLRRRLTESGLSYAEIADRERRDVALALIRGGQHPLSAVASKAGFADAHSLRRAVRRWTGKNPTDLQHRD